MYAHPTLVYEVGNWQCSSSVSFSRKGVSVTTIRASHQLIRFVVLLVLVVLVTSHVGLGDRGEVREREGVAGAVRLAQAGKKTVHQFGPAVLGELVELGWGRPEAGSSVEVRHERRVRRHAARLYAPPHGCANSQGGRH